MELNKFENQTFNLNPANINLIKVNNRTLEKGVTSTTSMTLIWCFFVNFGHILHFFSVFPLLLWTSKWHFTIHYVLEIIITKIRILKWKNKIWVHKSVQQLLKNAPGFRTTQACFVRFTDISGLSPTFSKKNPFSKFSRFFRLYANHVRVVSDFNCFKYRCCNDFETYIGESFPVLQFLIDNFSSPYRWGKIANEGGMLVY